MTVLTRQQLCRVPDTTAKPQVILLQQKLMSAGVLRGPRPPSSNQGYPQPGPQTQRVPAEPHRVRHPREEPKPSAQGHSYPSVGKHQV